jgi:SagB-type dehydrogenase family enzyme
MFRGEIKMVKLPQPRFKSNSSVEQTLGNRRSRRNYTYDPISLSDISQLCWAAQGITDIQKGFRTAPSAGGLYPIEIYVVVGNSNIESGAYHYSPEEHTLVLVKHGDLREQLYKAALDQKWVKEGAIDLVITGVFSRTTSKYGTRGSERYVWMEAGHVAENIYLQAEALGLGTVSVGAFYDEQVQETLSVPSDHTPLYIMPVGHI